MRFTIRASSLGELFDCAARWKAKHLDGKRMASNPKAHLGTALHASAAAFDQARLDGNPISIADAAGVFIDTLHDKSVDVDWSGEKDFTQRSAEHTGIVLHQLYCSDIAPTMSYTAIEQKCEDAEITLNNGVTLHLTGTLDRIYSPAPGKKGIADLKSSTNIIDKEGKVKTSGHALQMGIYELLDELHSGIPSTEPAKIIALKTKGDLSVGTGDIAGARGLLVGDNGEPGALEIAGLILKEGLFYGNTKSMMCSGQYCPVYKDCKWRK